MKSVQRGTLVTLGVWWQSQSSDPNVGINVLTADRPTDQGWGSTFYDVQVHIEKGGCLISFTYRNNVMLIYNNKDILLHTYPH